MCEIIEEGKECPCINEFSQCEDFENCDEYSISFLYDFCYECHIDYIEEILILFCREFYISIKYISYEDQYKYLDGGIGIEIIEEDRKIYKSLFEYIKYFFDKYGLEFNYDYEDILYNKI